MKYRILSKSVFAAVVSLSLFSCEKQVIYLPEDSSCTGFFGCEDGKYARQGRQFTVGYQHNLSEHAKDVAVGWCSTGDEFFTTGDNMEDNVSFKKFVWEEHGEKNVVVRVDYTYGNQRKSMLDTLTLAVVPPVFENFFFFDGKEVILETYPDAKVDEIYEITIINVVYSENEFDRFMLNNNMMINALRSRNMKDIPDAYEYMLDLLDFENPEHLSDPEFYVLPVYTDDITGEEMDDIYRLCDKMTGGEDLTLEDIDLIGMYYGKGFLEIILDEVFDYGALQYKIRSSMVKNDGNDNFTVSYSLK